MFLPPSWLVTVMTMQLLMTVTVTHCGILRQLGSSRRMNVVTVVAVTVKMKCLLKTLQSIRISESVHQLVIQMLHHHYPVVKSTVLPSPVVIGPSTSKVISTPLSKPPTTKGKQPVSRKNQAIVKHSQPVTTRTSVDKFSWVLDFDNSNSGNPPAFTGQRKVNLNLPKMEPINIFGEFFTEKLLHHIVYQTNLYANQVDINGPPNLILQPR